MSLKKKTFFQPSKQARILSLLDGVSINGDTSQSELGKKTGLSGAMVNSYLKQFQHDNLLILKPINGKNYTYELTPEGEKLRKNLLGEYCAEIVRIYTGFKDSVREKLLRLYTERITRIVLFGASETCEVVLSALQRTEFRILAIVDNDPDKQGEILQGMVVSPPDILQNIHFEAVIITTFAHQKEIQSQLEPLKDQKKFKTIGL